MSKRFGATEVLKDISFEVADGEFCILLGPSGCGKSTVLRMIAGLESPDTGGILIGGRKIDRLQPRQRDVAFVFQNYALYPHMTVFENLAFALRLRGAGKPEIEAKVLDAARLLEIENLLQRRPHALSGGQRQRVAVGRAIVRSPEIFLFDEPLSNLDAALRGTMRLELARLHRRLSATILYVTHDQAEALTLGDKIIVLDRGVIQQVGAPAEIYHRPANVMVAGFVGHPRMNLLEGSMDGAGVLECRGLRLDLAALLGASLPRAAVGPVTVGIRPEDLQPVTPGNGWISGEVDIVEDLGSDRFVHLRCAGDLEIIARAGRDGDLKAGAMIGLAAAPDRVHLFVNGERVGLRGEDREKTQ